MRDIRKIVDLLIKSKMTPHAIIDNVSDLEWNDFEILSLDECKEYARTTLNKLDLIILYYGE